MAKYIHYVWIDFKDEMNETPKIPTDFIERMENCKKLNSDFEIKVWNGKMCYDLMKTTFPSYLPLYESLPKMIMKCDMIRYFILYEYGGIYMDCDRICIKPFDSLLEKYKEYDVLLGEMQGIQHLPFYGLGNDFMVCKKKSDFMFYCMNSIKNDSGLFSYFQVMNVAGPVFLSKRVKSYKGTDKIKILHKEVFMCNEVHCDPEMIREAYTFPDMSVTTWHGTFGRMLYLLHRNLYPIIILILLFVIYKIH